MSATQANAIPQIQAKLTELQAAGKTEVPLRDVQELLQLVEQLVGQQGAGGGLYQQVGELAKFMNSARKELYTTENQELAQDKLPDATAQLEAVVNMAEEATQKIMDAAEAIGTAWDTFAEQAKGKVDEAALSQAETAIQDQVTAIFEACNFQDVTGQRIQKIVKLLEEVERQILRMVVVFGTQGGDAGAADTAERKALDEQAELLNGPQLPGQGLEQDQVDDLLNKLL